MTNPENLQISVRHIDHQSRWFVNAAKWALWNNQNNDSIYGTKRRTAIDIIEDALNQQLPTVRDPHPTIEDKDIVNLPETAAAREKLEVIQKEYADWIWADAERARELCRIYNETFNNRVTRRYDGSHLTFPGSNRNIVLRQSQKDAVWRILQSPTTFLAHAVGGGKTFAMAAAAMEMKRLKLAHKPLFAVPNHLVEQFAKEFIRLYPTANLLVSGKQDGAAQRGLLMSRIATHEWDGIIVSHSSFSRLPVHAETELEFEQSELLKIEAAILSEQKKDFDKRVIKTLERAKRKFEARMAELRDLQSHDNCICFEDLGIDSIFLDEAHLFKNLWYASKIRMAGLNQTDSGRARDLYLKSRWLLKKQGRGITFSSATPCSNSIAEIYTFLRYLAQDILHEHHLEGFDDWAANFGEVVTCLELAPEGQHYRVNSRFARFSNIPEMMSLNHHFCDIRTKDVLKLDEPKLRGGKPEVVVVPSTQALRDFIEELGARAEAVRDGEVDPREDNMLKITTDGRKAALDMRLVDPCLPLAAQTKSSVAAQRITEIWKATTDQRGAQMVFCDLATPSTAGFNVYADVRAHLVQNGIPETEIAFVHDYNSDAAKLQLYKDVNRGSIRVLFGSTEKLGCGTNVQERLAAMHHLDSPWRPSDIEQRDGRLLRPGNIYQEVSILRYVTEASFDSYIWQLLEHKIRFVTQFMNGDSTVRTADDIDSTVLSYAEVKALSTGNPKIMEKAAVDNEVARLSLLEKAWLNNRYTNQVEVKAVQENIRRQQTFQEAVRADIRVRQDTSGDSFRIEFLNQTITSRKDAGTELIRLAKQVVPGLNYGEARAIATLGGLSVRVRKQFISDRQIGIELAGAAIYEAEMTENPLGTIASLESQLRHFEDKLEKSVLKETEMKNRVAHLEGSLTGTFPHTEKLAVLRRQQAKLNEELQASQGDTLAVEDTETQDTTPAIAA